MAVVAATACSAGPSTSMNAPSSLSPPTGVSPAAAAVRLLDPAEFAAAIAGGRVTINVHVPDEGSVPGTDLAVPYDRITTQAAELPQDRSAPLAIYCRSGNMSAIAGPELTALGYTDVVELRGGMQAWQASGRPLLPAGG
jgi:rhodanese-related sulfurtransferase